MGQETPPPVTNQAKEMASARNARKFYVFPFLGPNCPGSLKTSRRFPLKMGGNPNGSSSIFIYFQQGFREGNVIFFEF